MKADNCAIKREKGPLTDLPKAAEAAGNYQEIPSSILSGYEQPDHQPREVETLSQIPPQPPPRYIGDFRRTQSRTGIRRRRGWGRTTDTPMRMCSSRDGSGSCDLGSGFGLGRHETGFPIRGRTRHSASQIRLRRERCSVWKEIIYKLFTLDYQSPVVRPADNKTLPSNF